MHRLILAAVLTLPVVALGGAVIGLVIATTRLNHRREDQ